VQPGMLAPQSGARPSVVGVICAPPVWCQAPCRKIFVIFWNPWILGDFARLPPNSLACDSAENIETNWFLYGIGHVESQGTDIRLLYLIKSRGPQSTQSLATALAITLPGARKHLNSLLDQDLVAFEDIARTVGRPKRLWRLTALAEKRFPDSHANLTLELIA